MTYRQLFDEAIGQAPPSSVDVDRVVAREARRLRARRTGAAGIAVVAVLATTVGVGTLRNDGWSAAPTPAAAASATPAADRERLTNAMLAALGREAPDLLWVTGATSNPGTWGGPVTTRPTWRVAELVTESFAGWHGWAVVARGDVRAWVRIEVATPKVAISETCGTRPKCAIVRGPGGETIRSTTFELYRRLGDGEPAQVLTNQSVEVFRPDGAQVTVQVRIDKDETLLSPAQLTAIGLDPALSPR